MIRLALYDRCHVISCSAGLLFWFQRNEVWGWTKESARYSHKQSGSDGSYPARIWTEFTSGYRQIPRSVQTTWCLYQYCLFDQLAPGSCGTHCGKSPKNSSHQEQELRRAWVTTPRLRVVVRKDTSACAHSSINSFHYLLSRGTVCSRLLAAWATTPTRETSNPCGSCRTYDNNPYQYPELFQKHTTHIVTSKKCSLLIYRQT